MQKVIRYLGKFCGSGNATPTHNTTHDDGRKSSRHLPRVLDDTQKRVIIIKSRKKFKFHKNRISRAKYTVTSFLPIFLFEQFRRYSNCYFLFICLLQQIPDVSPTGRYTTLMPLIFILSVSAVKEIVEDFRRHSADNEINNHSVEKLRHGDWDTVRWRSLYVGDIVMIPNDTMIPADLILLSSSEQKAMCFIETANLDGETNLKIRQGVPATAKFVETKHLRHLAGVVECDLPNSQLYEFNGVLTIRGKEPISLGPDQLLQRGAVLRNTAWVFGLVVYTGHNTKLMRNSTSAPLKRSTVDRETNIQIVMLFIILLVMCLTSTVFNFFWSRNHLSADYLGVDDSNSTNFGFNLLTFFILYSNVIPISLQVTLELVRYIQAKFINNDIQMYHVESNTPALARTSNLSEELGMIKYIFSDKTGTLTRNEMVFKKCSIVREIYETENTPDQSLLVQHLLNKHENAETIKEFLVLLSVCHSVIPEKHPDGSITYHAASPDERALVEGAKAYGFVFDTRTPDYVEIDALGTRERYEILHVLEFTSTRQRMSVICKTPEGDIKLYCKGADSVIYERLSEEEETFRDVTRSHLDEFATEGLRTLCCAVANIQQRSYKDWQITYHTASTSINDRQREMENAANLIETNLRLLGATAIEDKLQDGVPETIASLLEAGIFIWVLTGDKQETAINIGHSCCLISPTMDIILLNEESLDATREKIYRHASELQTSINRNCNVALVINGKTLVYALDNSLKGNFLELCTGCQVVICCRVSPLQKADVVEMVRYSTNSVTLAIGDGANDVAMIQKADVGVGISGVEGLQAACASDYSIAQFRYLKRLLLVHGSWNYRRITKVILYFFYKNICFFIMELWFAIYSGWSGEILFERWTIDLYNILFTAFPAFVIGIFEKHCSAETILKNPLLYKPSQNGELFNVKELWVWISIAFLHSVILFWLTLGAVGSESIWFNGKTSDFLVLGNHLYMYVIVTVCVKAGLSTESWTLLTHASIWGSIGLWLVFISLFSHFWALFPKLQVAPDIVGMERMIFSTPVFWFGLLLIPITALLADIVFIAVQNTVFKSLTAELTPLIQQLVDRIVADLLPLIQQLVDRIVANLLPNEFVRHANTNVATDVELPHGHALSKEED